MRTGSSTARGVDDSVVASFRERGWALTRTLDPDRVVELQRWTDELSSWPDGEGEWLHHREMTDHGPVLCRSENFIPSMPGCGAC